MMERPNRLATARHSFSPFSTTTRKIADFFPVFFRTQSTVKIKAFGQPEFSKSVPARRWRGFAVSGCGRRRRVGPG
jgi:hypothetical protein